MFERLERYAGKLARTVLRGRDGGNTVLLPGGGGNRSKESLVRHPSIERDGQQIGNSYRYGATALLYEWSTSWMPSRSNSRPRRVLSCALPYAETQAACEALRAQFTARYHKVAPKAVERLADDWARLVTFYHFPREHWVHLRTTNIVESPFATVRLRTTAAKRFKKVENATALIWKLLPVAESTFRRLKGAEVLPTRIRPRNPRCTSACHRASPCPSSSCSYLELRSSLCRFAVLRVTR